LGDLFQNRLLLQLAQGVLLAAAWAIGIWINKVSDREKQSEIEGQKQSFAGVQQKLDDTQKLFDPIKNYLLTKYPGVPIEKSLEDLKQNLEAQRGEIEKLKKHTSPRTISEGQRQELLSLLRSLGKFKIEIQSNPDREATSFKAILVKVFQEADWEVTANTAIVANDVVGLAFNNDKSKATTVAKIGQKFLDFGLKAEGAQYQDADTGRIKLYVGSNQ
jgi:hypothetical protein